MFITPVFLNKTTKKKWLQDVCNKYGDFKIAYSHKNKDGTHIFWKHKSIMECWHNDLPYLNKCNHRQILPWEIIIDLDDKKAIKNVWNICNELKRNNEEYYCFSTGSKGYHIHIINFNLLNKSSNYRRKVRESVYNYFKIKIDFAKSSDNVLIAMENTPHWKTGRRKELKRCNKWDS